MFVKTGAPFDACKEQHRIEVDIKQAGFRSSPRKVHGNVDITGPFSLFGNDVHLNVLTVPSMLRIKAECCLVREEPRNFEDVQFMLRAFADQARYAVRGGVISLDDLNEVAGKDKADAGMRDEISILLE